jgi:hypothetical protein
MWGEGRQPWVSSAEDTRAVDHVVAVFGSSLTCFAPDEYIAPPMHTVCRDVSLTLR